MSLRLSLLLNSALVALKQNTNASQHLCVQQATRAIDTHSDPVEDGTMVPMHKKLTSEELGKAYYRRGTARSALRDFEEAYNDLNQAVKLVPGDKSVEAELKKVVAKKEEQKKKQQKAYAKMFA